MDESNIRWLTQAQIKHSFIQCILLGPNPFLVLDLYNTIQIIRIHILWVQCLQLEVLFVSVPEDCLNHG